MGRLLKSPTRTISNRGEHPRFIGNFPCTKTADAYLPFDSLSSLLCGIWLEWRLDVDKILFEPRKYKFDATDSLPAIELIPDYECQMTNGEFRLVEAKYALTELRPEEIQKLSWAKSHFQNEGMVYEVVFRKTLEESGLIQSILLLRPYGQLRHSELVLNRAVARLQSFKPATLTAWRTNALKVGVSVGVLYQLLYQQRLAFIPEQLTVMELSQWLN